MRKPIGVVSIVVLSLVVLCCCGGAILGSLLPDPDRGKKPVSQPAPAASTVESPTAPPSSPAAAPSPSEPPPTTVAPPPPAVPPSPTKTSASPKPAPTKTSASPKAACHPNYSVCLPIVDDLDCGEIPYRNFRVIGGRDPYRLDGNDNDGWACES